MNCKKCGKEISGDLEVCTQCSTKVTLEKNDGVESQSNVDPWEMQEVVDFKYASFLKRVIAYILDGVIVSICCIPISIWQFVRASTDPYYQPNPFIAIVFGVIVGWAYYALLHSSKKQATVGKMALGLKVTDMNGDRLSLGRATGRFFAKYLSAVTLCIGFLVALFTKKKQTLHDKIAGTLVLEKE
ncbi:RDD family protein [Lutibacter sp. B2]|nr:RDD family protein [Lutibacter sp. B2]